MAIGVDTHKDTHVAVALDRLGRELSTLEIPASAAGYARLRAWAHSLGEPVFALEGAGSYGAGLARALAASGKAIYGVERPKRQERRRGKSDLIDASLAARRLLSGERLGELRGTGELREQLRLLLAERRSASKEHNRALNQLHALVVTAPPLLRERLAGKDGPALVHACRRLRTPASVASVARRLAQRVRLLAEEIAAVDDELRTVIAALAPELLAEAGVGPVCAAQLIVSCGKPSRLRSEACFARLAGVSPVPASSGRIQRHRLNRGGDRHLNQALHVIAIHRLRVDAETRTYQQRLIASGKTTREARPRIKTRPCPPPLPRHGPEPPAQWSPTT